MEFELHVGKELIRMRAEALPRIGEQIWVDAWDPRLIVRNIVHLLFRDNNGPIIRVIAEKIEDKS